MPKSSPNVSGKQFGHRIYWNSIIDIFISFAKFVAVVTTYGQLLLL
jgi:hypothetical protein